MDQILTLDTATLAVDFSAGFLLITWHGKVDFEEYKKVLTKASEIAEAHGIDKVIINRLDLRELNTECRIWMKNEFLPKTVRPLIPRLSKVATIESRSAMGQIYSKTISKTVSLVYPNLSFKSVSSEIEAYKWFLEEKEKPAAKMEAELIAATAGPYSDDSLERRRNTLIDNIYQLFFSWR